MHYDWGLRALKAVLSLGGSLLGRERNARRAAGASAELAEAWGKALAEGGYAVTGDASDLLPAAAPVAAPADPTLEERLASTTDALADLLVELARTRERAEELEKRNAKLERKKAKLRTRLAAALAEG